MYTNACARSYRLITHARHAKYPRTGFRSHHSAWPATPRSCGVHWSRCRLIGSDRGPGEPPSTVWYRDSSPRLKLARASRRHANLGPMRALGEAPNRSSRALWKALLASGRAARGLLSIMRLTRHHVVLGPSPNPRGGTLSRPVYRKTDAPLTRSAGPRRGDLGEHVSDPFHASGRPVRGSLGIGKLIRYHTVLGLSQDPRGGPLSRHGTRRTVATSASAGDGFGSQTRRSE